MQNSSRSFQVLSFFNPVEIIVFNKKIKKGFTTIKNVQEKYYVFQYYQDSHGNFYPLKIAAIPVMSSKDFFKLIQGDKFQDEDDSNNDI
jgi:hypothetical protein